MSKQSFIDLSNEDKKKSPVFIYLYPFLPYCYDPETVQRPWDFLQGVGEGRRDIIVRIFSQHVLRVKCLVTNLFTGL